MTDDPHEKRAVHQARQQAQDSKWTSDEDAEAEAEGKRELRDRKNASDRQARAYKNRNK